MDSNIKETAKEMALKAATEIIEKEATKFIETELQKDHGSKVKRGAYEECSIVLVGTKACISIGDANYLELTDENVQKVTFVKEKNKIAHTYYYYELLFRDGKTSYVRMRRKYKDAMYAYCSCV